MNTCHKVRFNKKHENTPNKNICWSLIFTSEFHPGRIQQDYHVSVEVLCWFLGACSANLEVTDRLKRSYEWYHPDRGFIDSSHAKICIWHGSVEIFEDQLWTGRMQYGRCLFQIVEPHQTTRTEGFCRCSKIHACIKFAQKIAKHRKTSHFTAGERTPTLIGMMRICNHQNPSAMQNLDIYIYIYIYTYIYMWYIYLDDYSSHDIWNYAVIQKLAIQHPPNS